MPSSVYDPYAVVRQFEATLCEYTGAKYAETTTSCTMALLLACSYFRQAGIPGTWEHVLHKASAHWQQTTNPWKFALDGIPPAPRGVPQIEVTLDIDASGILKVTAKDKATNRSQHITITASSGLSEAEVEQMRQDAQAHADEDRQRKELIEARNDADNTAYAAEKTIQDFGDKIDGTLKTDISLLITDLRSKARREDVAAIKSANESLQKMIQKLGSLSHEAGTSTNTKRTNLPIY